MLFVVDQTGYEGNKLSFSSLLNVFMKCILQYSISKRSHLTVIYLEATLLMYKITALP